MKKISGILLSMVLATAFIFSFSSTAFAKTVLKITKQPTSVTVANGSTAKVSFKVSGDSLKYKWYYKNPGSKKFTATSSFKGNSYSLKMNKDRSGRQVYCVVTDKYGKKVQTKTVTLKMQTPLKITKQPSSVAVLNGNTAKVSFKVSGDSLKYKWYYKNPGSSKFSATSSFKGNSYSLKMNKDRSGRQVYCVVTDKYGKKVQTKTVTISMKTPLKITKQPSSVAVLNGKTAKVSFKVSGDSLKYKWYYKNPGSSKFSTTSSFKSNYYSVSMNKDRNNRQVYCVITDKYGASVKTSTVTLSMRTPLKITTQPTSVAVASGTKASATVKATGDSLSYKWYYKNPGSSKFSLASSFKSTSYSVTMDTSINGRQVYCVVTDKYGDSVKTSTATLSMKTPLKITTNLKNITVKCNEKASFSVAATGDSLKYQWYIKKSADKAYTLSKDFTGKTLSVSASNGMSVYCVITDKYGASVKSVVASVSTTHAYNNGVITKNATCTEDGIKTFTCSDCGTTRTEAVKAPGHSMGQWEEFTEATVTAEGEERSYCANCEHYESRILEKLTAVYFITIITGEEENTVIGVAENGKYTLETPVKTGYTFKAWKDADGNEFPSSGIQKANVEIAPVWEIEGTNTLEELIERTDACVDRIMITDNITVDQPIFISSETEIYADEDFSIIRKEDYTGDIFVAGQNRNGESAALLHRSTVLTLGGGKGMLTIDGNKDTLTADVNGSAIFVSDSATVNLKDNLSIINHKKLGNDRVMKCTEFASELALERAGGSAVLIVNGTVNMYDGVTISDNEVITEEIPVTDEKGNTYISETAACGGAIYNRGNFNMYGGTISGNKALRGGAIYNDEYIDLVSGNIANNSASTYGGAISSSASADVQIFVGSEDENDSLAVSGNTSKKAGGAIYSNTNSPIVIYGNTTFDSNNSGSIGGAIYTGGDLSVIDTEFKNNTAPMGGAIYHKFSDTNAERRVFEAENCTFNGNTANYGGAIALGATENSESIGTYAKIKACTFTANRATDAENTIGDGGAIYASNKSELTVDSCQFNQNSAVSSGGGIQIHDNSKLNLKNSTFQSNTATNGGAVNIAKGNLTLSNSQFNSNSASYGGAIFANPTDIQLTSSSFTNNTAVATGGAVCLNGSTMTVTGESEFKGNTAGNRGGAIDATVNGENYGKLTMTGGSFSENTSKVGGAVCIRTNGTASFNGTSFISNASTDENASNDKTIGGGAIYGHTGTTITLSAVTMDGNTSANYGGAVMVNSGNLDINTNSALKNSTGSTGVAIYLYNCVSSKIKDVTISGNIAKWNGAVYSNAGTLEAENVTATGNTADKGSSFYISGGTATLKNITASKNSAKYGGVMYVAGGEATVNGGTFTENTVTETGGVICAEGGKVNAESITASLNTAYNGGVFGATAGEHTITSLAATQNSATNGGAVSARNAATTITINTSVFDNNTAKYGGAIHVREASVTIDSSEIKNHIGSDCGGAVFATLGTFSANSTKFNNNSSGYGGAVSLNGTVMTVTGESEFKNNTASTRGGAIDVTLSDTTYGSLNMTGGIFESNSAPTGGAVYVRTNGTASFNGTSFISNKSTDENASNDKTIGGGAIYGHTGTAITLSAVTMDGNTSKNYGGTVMINSGNLDINTNSALKNSTGSTGVALYLYNCVSSKIKDVTISDNTAKWNGAVYSNAGTLEIENVTATNNTADKGSSFYISGGTATLKNITANKNSAKYGGVIFVGGGEVNVTGGTFTENTVAERGGAIYAEGGKVNAQSITASLNNAYNGGVFGASAGEHTITSLSATQNSATNGGAIYANGTAATITVNSSVFDANSATNGGAVYANNSVINLSGSEIRNHTTTSAGGAVYTNLATINVADTKLSENASAYGGAVSLNGTAMIVTGESEFKNNTATTRGGAIDATVSGEVFSTINMTGGIFESNSAPTGGAVYVRTNGTANFNGTSFISNKSTDENAANDKTIGGGAIYGHTGSAITLSAVTMDKNESAKYGGAVMTNGGTVNMNSQSSITSSKALTHGAAMYLYKANATVTDTDISNNEATWQGTIYAGDKGTLHFENITATNNKANQGGLFCLCDQSTVTMKNITATGNSAKAEGGAIYQYAWGGSLGITNCTFTNNTAVNKGGAICDGAKTPVTISGGKFEGNSSKTGGAIYMDTIMANSPANITIKDATLFKNNIATGGDGGAIVIADSTSAGTNAVSLKMNGITFEANKSYNMGGALATDTTSSGLVINATNCIFKENRAGYNSTGTPGGGAVEIQNGNGFANGDPTSHQIVFTGCTFTSNSAPGVGGAVDIRSCSYVKFDSLTATGNVCTNKWNGAVLYLTSEGSRLYLTGTITASDNTAGGKDTFAYINNAKAWLYTTGDNTQSWVPMTYSMSEIKYNQTF